jgi:cellulose biosynthesis protein BcsQ
VFATYNIKGGVGKTSTAVNLAYLAAEDGYRTLLWDLDPQAAASYVFRIRPRVKGGAKALVRGARPLDDAIKGTDYDGLDLLPADFTYRNMDLALHEAKRPTRQLSRLLRPMADEYDVVFLDCPPSISLVSENILRAVHTLLVPLIPSTLSERTFEQLTSFIDGLHGHRPQVLAFFSMVDRRKRLHRDVTTRLPAERSDIAVAMIPSMTVVEQMAVRRAPVPAFAPRSAAAAHYRQLWAELRDRAGLAGVRASS